MDDAEEEVRACRHCDRAEATVGRLRGLVIRLTKAIGHSPTCPQAVTRCNCGKAQEIVAAHAEGAYVVRDAALAEAQGEVSEKETS